MVNRDAWRALETNARALFALELTGGDVERLRGFVDLLKTWSARMNLVGPSSKHDLLDRHLLDSFALLPFLVEVKTLADYGSGAGFPALPMAIIRPDVRFHLVEPRRKRCSFLRQVARAIGMPNVTVSESRGEDWIPPEEISVVTSRALALETLSPLAARVLPTGGRLLVMKKQGDAAPAISGFTPIETRAYRLPGPGDRHEVVAYRRV